MCGESKRLIFDPASIHTDHPKFESPFSEIRHGDRSLASYSADFLIFDKPFKLEQQQQQQYVFESTISQDRWSLTQIFKPQTDTSHIDETMTSKSGTRKSYVLAQKPYQRSQTYGKCATRVRHNPSDERTKQKWHSVPLSMPQQYMSALKCIEPQSWCKQTVNYCSRGCARSIFVGNLPPIIDQDVFLTEMRRIGCLTNFEFYFEQDCWWTAFLTYSTPEEADEALKFVRMTNVFKYGSNHQIVSCWAPQPPLSIVTPYALQSENYSDESEHSVDHIPIRYQPKPYIVEYANPTCQRTTWCWKDRISLLKDGPLGANLFIYGLPNDWTEVYLLVLFQRFGNILGLRVPDAAPVNGAHQMNRGYGFVSYSSPHSSVEAYKAFNGKILYKRKLNIQLKGSDSDTIAAMFQQGVAQSQLPKTEYEMLKTLIPILKSAPSSSAPSWSSHVSKGFSGEGSDETLELQTHKSEHDYQGVSLNTMLSTLAQNMEQAPAKKYHLKKFVQRNLDQSNQDTHVNGAENWYTCETSKSYDQKLNEYAKPNETQQLEYIVSTTLCSESSKQLRNDFIDSCRSFFNSRVHDKESDSEGLDVHDQLEGSSSTYRLPNELHHEVSSNESYAFDSASYHQNSCDQSKHLDQDTLEGSASFLDLIYDASNPILPTIDEGTRYLFGESCYPKINPQPISPRHSTFYRTNDTLKIEFLRRGRDAGQLYA